MNIPQLIGELSQQPSSTNGGTPYPLTRHEKARSFLSETVPQLIHLTARATTHLPSRYSVAPASIATSAGVSRSLAGSTAPGAASLAGIFSGVVGAANIALSWGKSTPAVGAANGLAVGATIGSIVPGIGTALGAAAGAVIGGLLGCIKTGKHHDQKVRDSVRALLVEQEVISPDYKIALADGSLFDIGIDGGPKAELGGRRPYEVDFNNPLAQYAVAWLDPVLDLLSQGNQKVKTDFVGYFANAALSNARDVNEVRDNVQAIIRQFGITDEALARAVAQAAEAGTLDRQTALTYLHGIEQRQQSTIEVAEDREILRAG